MTNAKYIRGSTMTKRLRSTALDTQDYVNTSQIFLSFSIIFYEQIL